MGQRKSKPTKSYNVVDKSFEYEKAVSTAHTKEETPQLDEQVDDAIVDSVAVPTWIDAGQFEKILRDNVDGFVKITNFKAYPALKPGENYATVILRIIIDVQLKDQKTQQVSFIMKIPHDLQTEQLKEAMQSLNFFIPENLMYFDVIPELEEMYRNVGVDVCLSAKAYKLDSNTEQFYVLLEDLRPKGYKNTDRLKCLDMEHTECVLRKLAQFHAVSACRVATKGALNPIFMSNLFTEEVKAVFESMIDLFKASFDKHIEKGQYAAAVDACFAHFLDGLERLHVYDDDDFVVLNHGDCWSNNILFKYDSNGRVIDTMFVDYQMSKFGPPAQDIFYFIMSSINIEFKLKNFAHFIRCYYDSLIENLKILNYPKRIPTLRELYTQLFKYPLWAFNTCLITLPIVLLESTDCSSSENFMSPTEEGKKFRELLFTNKRYQGYIKEILPWLYNHGLLEGYETDADYLATRQKKDNVTGQEVKAIAAPVTDTETSRPQWLTEAYFVDILNENVAHYKQIKNFDVTVATKPGDNYSAVLYEVDIEAELEDGSTKPLSFMLKVSPDNPQSKAVQNMFDTFNKELAIYDEWLAKFEQLYKEVGVDVTFGPKSYKFSMNPGTEVVLLDNLRTSGFKNADRLSGLDEVHVKCVLDLLAQFHAASAHWQATKGDFPKVVMRSGMFSEETRQIMEQMLGGFINQFLEALKTYKGNEEYIDKFKNFNEIAMDLYVKMGHIDTNEFNVLNHGDCWTNNIMFKYDDKGRIEDIKFIDYQLIRYGSPAYDLYYFLLSSPSLELKIDQFDYFIKYYHERLQYNLNLLKYPKRIPTLKELHVDLLKNGFYGVATVSGVMSVALFEPPENANMDLMSSADEAGADFRALLYTNEGYKKHAEALLLWLNRRGLLGYDAAHEQEIETNTANDAYSKWLNKEHFLRIVKEDYKEVSKILKLTAVPATQTGDNYASLMLRVLVEAELQNGTSEHISYMLKVPLVFEQMVDLPQLWNFFEKEISMYADNLPDFERMYEEVGRKLKFGPKYFKLNDEVVLLEDLHKPGFKNADRLQGLDVEHTKCVLRKLAQLHAASARRVELRGLFADVFNNGTYTEDSRATFKQLLQKIEEPFLEAVRDYKDNEEYFHKIPHLQAITVDSMIELNKYDPEEFNVLNHGDCWSNNVMFQYDEAGNIKETLFVDFQVSQYGSPARDLYYFLLSSTQLDIKVDQFDNFVQYYHEHLLENLKLLQYGGAVPTLEQLQASLKRSKLMAWCTITGIATVCLLEPTENASLEYFTAETESAQQFRKTLYSNKPYKSHAEKVLLWLNRRNLLDFK